MFILMSDFLFAPGNAPFSVALLVVMIIALLEGVGTLFGMGISGVMDSLFPEVGLEMDAPDMDSPTSLGRLLSWIRVKGVPVLILMIIFLTSFGLLGLMMQKIITGVFGQPLNSIIVTIPAIFMSLPVVRLFGMFFQRYMPKDETSAVGLDSFIGLISTITLGEARTDFPAQSKLKDKFGKTHYIMVEPDDGDTTFRQHDDILLVRRVNSVFFGIKNINKTLVDND
jgi:hypothetical protein